MEAPKYFLCIILKMRDKQGDSPSQYCWKTNEIATIIEISTYFRRGVDNRTIIHAVPHHRDAGTWEVHCDINTFLNKVGGSRILLDCRLSSTRNICNPSHEVGKQSRFEGYEGIEELFSRSCIGGSANCYVEQRYQPIIR